MKKQQGKLYTDIERFIKEVILPLLEIDNGTISLIDIENATVRLKLGGNCIGCPGAIFTCALIKELLHNKYPEIQQVVFEDWSPALTHKTNF